jgi:hypothetical protein
MSETPLPPGLEPSFDTNGAVQLSNGAFSLENILGENHDAVEHPGTTSAEKAVGWDEEEAEVPLADGYCVECEGKYPVSSQ